MKKHYHVLIGMTGCYMPDTNFHCATRKEAVKTAIWAKKNMFEDEKVFGSAENGYLWTNSGECIKITTCKNVDCKEED